MKCVSVKVVVWENYPDVPVKHKVEWLNLSGYRIKYPDGIADPRILKQFFEYEE